MASSNADLKKAFLAYCSVIDHESTKGNSSCVRKMCTDSGINKTKMKQNDIDLEYVRCFGTSKEGIDFKAFLVFVEEYLGPVYGRMNGMGKEDAIAEVKQKLSSVSPQLRNATKPSNDAIVQRLTDPNAFPQAHKSQPSAKPRQYNPAPGRQLSKK
ncbi:hypothetical protein CRM22_003086 [Opisthorchis felineus]|uniref:Uncharacterized protein n=1 Tax=Opisthorchis felineus TaxID=147828 RepID=A0A4S2M7P2_OPIFE|nr:hypothetical protein CRM22_003086 [Opisthorchis felineus]